MKNLFVLLIALLTALHPFFNHQSTSSSITRPLNWEAIADSVHQATLEGFLSKNGTYVMQANEGNATFHYWWNAHDIDVLLFDHLRGKHCEELMLTILKGIRDNNKGQLPNDYYDDMEWLALASLRAYQATNNHEFLDVANLLWEDIKTGWNDHQGGGVAWRKNQRDYKNTPANAPAVILAGRLYKMDEDSENLDWAKKIYEWQRTHLVDPKTGLVWDGMNRNGDQKIDKDWRFTYNQGVYIGASMVLYELTGEEFYLQSAIQTADYVLSDEHLAPGGILKSEGNGDGGLFKGILIRYLTQMITSGYLPEDRKQAYTDFIRQNAFSVYRNLNRPAMLIGPSWTKKSADVIDASTQLSGLMLFEAIATLD